jgi:Phytanoyl-CoA dioxygenase (PhyH)
MILIFTGKLRRSVRRLNRAVGREVPYPAVAALVRTHRRPNLMARILSRVLEFEADREHYNGRHPRREQQRYNHRCDYQGSVLVSRALSLFFDRYDLTRVPTYHDSFVTENTRVLGTDGCVLLPRFVSAAQCDRIVKFLGRTDIVFREDPGGTQHHGYTAENVEATRANVCRVVDQSTLLRCPDISSLVFNPNFIALAQDFLGAPPVHAQVNAWWSVAYSQDREHLSAAAQKFHQDRDFIKFLKIFIYLTDVDADSGPHEFIAGSNVDYAKFYGPYRASKRRTDAELLACYGRERLRSFTAPRGSVLIEDTSGFHKGAPVRNGHRMLLQIEYVSSLYGSPRLALSRVAAGALDPALASAERLVSGYGLFVNVC